MSGMSIIELIIVVVVVVLITSIIIFSFSVVSRNQLLNNSVDQVTSLVKEARAKTLSSENLSQFGVHFASTSATLFEGELFVGGAVTNKVITLPESLEISNISLTGGGDDILFQRITGKTNEPGYVTVDFKSGSSKERKIIINIMGVIDVE